MSRTEQTTPALPTSTDQASVDKKKTKLSEKTRRARNLAQLEQARQTSRQKRQALEKWREDMTHRVKVLEVALENVEEALVDLVERVNAIPVNTPEEKKISSPPPVDMEVKEDDTQLQQELLDIIKLQAKEMQHMRKREEDKKDTTQHQIQPLVQRHATIAQPTVTTPAPPRASRAQSRTVRKTRAHQLW